ncbi:uncharacterized protein CMC5_019240 [Chondromyces crocatus]|uniref:Uncharacterized protein n=1 Tax=Chondromyces crocatus TaxID=52 RepID=A0A0K1EAS7_CHOCO|nr:uncharacterized protein CMC5_019240 [Chondromyces crocatus]
MHHPHPRAHDDTTVLLQPRPTSLSSLEDPLLTARPSLIDLGRL